MTPIPRGRGPTAYELRVEGHLDPHWAPWFGHLTMTHQDDGTTILIGMIADQGELHGLLTKIRDLGITLISVAAVAQRASHLGNTTSGPAGGRAR